MMKKLTDQIAKRQDGDGHWYWIPNELLSDFGKVLKRIEGKDYMDCPDDFDSFSEDFDIYRTLGCEDNVPDIFIIENDYGK